MARWEEIFRIIVQEEGPEIFDDPYRFFLIAEDLSGGAEEKMMEMLYEAAEQNVLPLVGAAWETSGTQRWYALQLAEQSMRKNGKYTDQEASRFLQTFCDAFGWKRTAGIEAYRQQYENRRQTGQTQTRQNTAQIQKKKRRRRSGIGKTIRILLGILAAVLVLAVGSRYVFGCGREWAADFGQTEKSAPVESVIKETEVIPASNEPSGHACMSILWCCVPVAHG